MLLWKLLAHVSPISTQRACLVRGEAPYSKDTVSSTQRRTILWEGWSYASIALVTNGENRIRLKQLLDASTKFASLELLSVQILWRQWVHWSKWEIMPEKSSGCFPCWPQRVGRECATTLWLACKLCSVHCPASTPWPDYGKLLDTSPQCSVATFLKVDQPLPSEMQFFAVCETFETLLSWAWSIIPFLPCGLRFWSASVAIF